MSKNEYKKMCEDMIKDLGLRMVEEMEAMSDEDIEREHIALMESWTR